MDGFVRNISNTWRHALKRSVAPGQKIELDVLYEEYGLKHDIKKGQPFADWIRAVKLKDAGTWEINFTKKKSKAAKTKTVTTADSESQEVVVEEVVVEAKPEPVEVVEEQTHAENVAPFVTDENNEVMDIVKLSVRKAREVLPTIASSALLTQAHAIARTQSGKDTLTNLIKKRMDELKRIGGR